MGSGSFLTDVPGYGTSESAGVVAADECGGEAFAPLGFSGLLFFHFMVLLRPSYTVAYFFRPTYFGWKLRAFYSSAGGSQPAK